MVKQMVVPVKLINSMKKFSRSSKLFWKNVYSFAPKTGNGSLVGTKQIALEENDPKTVIREILLEQLLHP